jgi:hypothetical protein
MMPGATLVKPETEDLASALEGTKCPDRKRPRTGGAVDPQAQRVAENDAAFRRANESIELAAAESDVSLVPFICECAETTCTEILRLTLAEYEAVRANSRRFINAAGHHVSARGWAVPVEEHERYVVVEKVGDAGVMAEQLDQRQEAG